jgi:SPP1 gp7 family putative phage head morphogenesis protein
MPPRRTNKRARSRVPRPSTTALERLFAREAKAFASELQTELQPWIRRAAVPDTGQRSDAREESFLEIVQRVLAQWYGRDSDRELIGALGSLARRLTRKATASIGEITGVDPRRFVGDAGANAFRRQNLTLIRTVPREHVSDLIELYQSNRLEGLNVDDLTAVLRERAGVSQARARFWARDQTLKFNAQVVETRCAQAGVTEYTWRATLDERNRPDHRALHGQRFRFSAPPVVDQASGRRANPGEDYQCRCVAEPVI